MSTIEEPRNWLELPHDVILLVLMKLDCSQILENVQFVCKLWYNCCKDPSIWRTIVMIVGEFEMVGVRWKNMLYNAVDRSYGGLINLNIEGFGSDDDITYVAHRSSQLKHLRLARCLRISGRALIEAFGKLPSLEVVELTLCSFASKQTVAAINCCPSSIKTFKLNKRASSYYTSTSDDEALAIAANMPGLIHLQLIGNTMTNAGLEAILNNCSQLQSLDLRACFNIRFHGNVAKRCYEQIKDLRGPFDSTYDYNYPTTPTVYYSSDDDLLWDDYMISSHDLDYMSDYSDNDPIIFI